VVIYKQSFSNELSDVRVGSRADQSATSVSGLLQFTEQT
jgi:hypothetical protein